MVSALDSGASGLGWSPCRGRCVVFLGKTLTLTVPLFTQVYKWVPVNCWGNLTKLQGSDLQWTNILSKRLLGSSKYCQPLHATETGISSGSYELALAPRLQFLGSGLHTPTQLFWEYPNRGPWQGLTGCSGTDPPNLLTSTWPHPLHNWTFSP